MSLRRIAPLLVALALPLSAQAAEKGPLDTLKDAQGRLDKIIASGDPATPEVRAKLESEAKTLFAFDELAKRALGKKWETGTKAQQEEFVALFSQRVRDKYLDQIKGQSAKGFKVEWGKETLSGSEATVASNVKGKTTEGKPVDVDVDYKLTKVGASWMVYDVVTDGDSLLETYKEQFADMFKKGGDFEGVLKKLRGKK
jgi:phospholipid transport system substrate-binding protein